MDIRRRNKTDKKGFGLQVRFGAFFYLKDAEKVCGVRFYSDWRLDCLIVGKNIRDHRRNKVLTVNIKKHIINLKVNYFEVNY